MQTRSLREHHTTTPPETTSKKRFRSTCRHLIFALATILSATQLVPYSNQNKIPKKIFCAIVQPNGRAPTPGTDWKYYQKEVCNDLGLPCKPGLYNSDGNTLEIQEFLQKKGFYKGKLDIMYGLKTREALEDFYFQQCMK